MKLVIQRVKNAECDVDGETVSRIGEGLLVYVSFKAGDTDALIPKMASKTVNLRIFEDSEGKMNRSLKATGGSVLAVSQFTLEGDARKGNRPSFTKALNPKAATKLFDAYVDALGKAGVNVATGQFQAHMEITSTNDGPVTILLERTHDDD
ncbi:MAG: D-aminoacyl-tRNA deacylase [Candidatus Izemoplasmataceae bacterium]